MEDIKKIQSENPLKILRESVPLNRNNQDGLSDLKKIIPLSNQKRDLKNKPSKNNKDKYKSTKAVRIKAWIGAIIVALGTFIAAKEAVQNYGEYMFTSGIVNELSTEEIMDKIDDILKAEVSKGTGEKIEDIEFYKDSQGTTFSTTTVKVGENEYVEVVDIRGGGSHSTLKANKLKKLIDKSNNGTRKDLIKTLRDAKEYTEEYEIVEEDGVLKEKKDKNLEKDENTTLQKNNQNIIEDDGR